MRSPCTARKSNPCSLQLEKACTKKQRRPGAAKKKSTSYVHKNLTHACLHVCMLSRFSRVQLCATLWTTACQAPLCMGFSRQEYWSGLPCPPPGDLPNPGIEPALPASPALQEDYLPTESPGLSHECLKQLYS